jgi:hypothetical protein
VQERQNRVCTTVAIAIVAETCMPFTVSGHTAAGAWQQGWQGPYMSVVWQHRCWMTATTILCIIVPACAFHLLSGLCWHHQASSRHACCKQQHTTARFGPQCLYTLRQASGHYPPELHSQRCPLPPSRRCCRR